MDVSCLILTCVLLFQMAVILVMLNPVYDVRKITQVLNKNIRYYSSYFFFIVMVYFACIVYLGMFIPLHNIYLLIFSTELDDYEKILLLRKVEKNYIIAGFSLFLIVVQYGVKALVSYTASLLELSVKQSDKVQKQDRNSGKKDLCSSANILPNLLRVKRSISYETILFSNELREQLRNVLENVEFPHNRGRTLASILEMTNQSPKATF